MIFILCECYSLGKVLYCVFKSFTEDCIVFFNVSPREFGVPFNLVDCHYKVLVFVFRTPSSSIIFSSVVEDYVCRFSGHKDDIMVKYTCYEGIDLNIRDAR